MLHASAKLATTQLQAELLEAQAAMDAGLSLLGGATGASGVPSAALPSGGPAAAMASEDLEKEVASLRERLEASEKALKEAEARDRSHAAALSNTAWRLDEAEVRREGGDGGCIHPSMHASMKNDNE